jgi:hypothetical protein
MPAAGGAPIDCGGVQIVTRVNEVIDGGSEPAIEAGGNCSVTCNGCTLNSSDVAVVSAGNATVTLINCTVTGQARSLYATGNGTIVHTGTTLNGRTRRSGRGQIISN